MLPQDAYYCLSAPYISSSRSGVETWAKLESKSASTEADLLAQCRHVKCSAPLWLLPMLQLLDFLQQWRNAA